MNTPLSNEVLAAWHDNRKVEAIKLLREQTGLGLKESKDLLESLDSAGTLPQPTTAAEQDLAKQQLREQLEKMGVKDADALLDSMGHGSDGSGGSSFTSVTRTSKTVNSVVTNFSYNGSLLMAQVTGGGANQIKQLYSYDASGQLVSVNYNGTE